ncbi:hypothetical protein [Subtercola boreus]|uniref:Glycosyltransferase subfamily 4-like N-terminal domain-containing protein n=1 Tax=Subtercola boreus TaxID=120213 RepID=A0A3E0W9G6_9MICO|nr:hypothetical protein [Subtercola boreus]RFA19030.1 hypothetical protein B7R24_12905 [Subtercola boreus]RFA19168.1 hypothetical protein B7R23_12885 [Subtercola boreus]RFA25630.1 hypothetical protein B7R25_13005 [Subtercola boreus]
MTGSTGIPTQLVVGSPRHAVTRYAEALCRAIAACDAPDAAGPARDPVEPVGAHAPVVRVQNARDALEAVAGIRTLHVQFTDRLFGATPEHAAELIEELAARTRLTVTLHDLPQHSDGEGNLPRRAAAYARVVRAARGVACNSRHEALLLGEFSLPGWESPVAVIPLPVEGAPARSRDARAEDTVPGTPADTGAPAGTGTPAEAAILGYFYPGKGHAEVIGAVAAGRLPLAVTALGTAAPGHDDDLATVVASAAGLGVTFTSTGYLDDHALASRLDDVAVPVAAHQHLSASASINTWIASGRRPLIPDGRYSREMAELRPGTVTVYAPHELARALEHAARHPETTRLAPGTSVRPDVNDVAQLYLTWWAGLR